MVKRVNKRILLTGLVVALGALLVWVDPRGSQEFTPDPDAQAEEPGHVLKNATVTLFSATGNIEQSLATPYLVHTPQQATTHVTSPRATLFDNEQREWIAVAHEGVLNTDTYLLSLSGSAQLLAPEEDWRLETEQLHYDGVSRHAWSEAPVTLQQPPQHMSASRMDVWLDTSHVRLTNDVRGRHPSVTTTPQETP